MHIFSKKDLSPSRVGDSEEICITHNSGDSPWRGLRVETLTHTRKPSMLALQKLTNIQGSVWNLLFREMTITSRKEDSTP